MSGNQFFGLMNALFFGLGLWHHEMFLVGMNGAGLFSCVWHEYACLKTTPSN